MTESANQLAREGDRFLLSIRQNPGAAGV